MDGECLIRDSGFSGWFVLPRCRDLAFDIVSGEPDVSGGQGVVRNDLDADQNGGAGPANGPGRLNRTTARRSTRVALVECHANVRSVAIGADTGCVTTAACGDTSAVNVRGRLHGLSEVLCIRVSHKV